MNNNIEHFFMCLLTISLSSLVKPQQDVLQKLMNWLYNTNIKDVKSPKQIEDINNIYNTVIYILINVSYMW